MLYHGHIRRQIAELRDKLAYVLGHDESAALTASVGNNRVIVVTGDAETREAFETLYERCIMALRL